MKKRVISALVFCLLSSAAAEEIPPNQLKFFEEKIRPILVEKCYSCHSAEAEKVKGGLLLDTREATLRGGDTGPAVVAGNLEESLLIEAIRWESDDLEMPPKEKLSEAEIRSFERWVEMGAPDPRAAGEKQLVKSSIDYEAGREFWAFQPPVAAEPPAVKNSNWSKTEIDRFVLAALEAKGLKPVADADPRKLLRRLYFDLIGLPPSPEQIAEFDPENLAAVVDELLESPHFGERWGRHWLDVARFSESNGMERNFTYPTAWRYRDYVIASFQADKPFDQFVREQIAGDYLASEAENQAQRDEFTIATGFLALGPKMLNERDQKVFSYEVVDEQIDATTRAFMGLTASCARCHDHKFDPIAQHDYYALAGIFRSTETCFGTTGGGGNRQASTLVPVGEDAEKRIAERAQHKKQVDAWSKEKLDPVNRALKKAQQEVNRLKRQKAKPEEIKKQNAEVAKLKKESDRLKKEVAARRREAPPAPDYAMAVRDRENAQDSPLLIRGNLETPAEVVPRGFLAVMDDRKLDLDAGRSGRQELADWIASAENPLTARVAVNRIWSHLFGEGIVRTVDNFGASGELPANQQLLDFLAVRFVENGWSTKSLIREIVLSRAYQLSSEKDESNYAIDPDNRLVWRQNLRRLDAESMRDAMLSASGLIELTPPSGSVVAKMGDVNFGRDGKAGQLMAEGVAANHRSVYLPIIRNAVPTILTSFDFAEPSLIVGKRDETTVPSQALFMMNSEFVEKQASSMAKRVLEAESSESARIDLAYRIALGRAPNAEEVARASGLIHKAQTELDDAELAAWSVVCQALLSSAEFAYLN